MRGYRLRAVFGCGPTFGSCFSRQNLLALPLGARYHLKLPCLHDLWKLPHLLETFPLEMKILPSQPRFRWKHFHKIRLESWSVFLWQNYKHRSISFLNLLRDNPSLKVLSIANLKRFQWSSRTVYFLKCIWQGSLRIFQRFRQVKFIVKFKTRFKNLKIEKIIAFNK